MKVEIGMGGFLIYFVSYGAVRFSVDVHVQECKVTFFFFFHCKLYLVVESIEVVQKLCQFFLAMGPDDEHIIYTSEPAYRFVSRLF